MESRVKMCHIDRPLIAVFEICVMRRCVLSLFSLRTYLVIRTDIAVGFPFCDTYTLTKEPVSASVLIIHVSILELRKVL